jgi:aminoglycoside phosphotransferase (APT) family kinase protein
VTEASLTEVRAAHRIDEAALRAYLEQHQPGFEGPLRLRQFEGGQSNPTYLLESTSGRYVLRKQPPGDLLPSAHQVDREYRVMHALAQSQVPVPRMRCLCTDRSVIGTSFYVMDYVPGRVYGDVKLPGLTRTERGQVYRELARTLAALHAVDPRAVGLGDFGRAGNYFARQIARWGRQYEASQTEQIDAMSELMAWLPAHLPASEAVSIVHGDYRIGNCLLHQSEPRICAVLDWELSTLGDPLADLGYVCQIYYIDAFDIGLAAVDTAALGIPSQTELVGEYCAAAGVERVEALQFSIIYNLFRLAGISQGVYKRGLEGNASSAMALQFKDVVRQYAQTAWGLVEQLEGSASAQPSS